MFFSLAPFGFLRHSRVDYLDWRSCYGLDYKKVPNSGEEDSKNGEESNDADAEDWDKAAKKAMKVQASMDRAKAMEKKLKEASKKPVVQEKVDPYAEMEKLAENSNSAGDHGEADDRKDADKDAETMSTTEVKAASASETDEFLKAETLTQLVFVHKAPNGTLRTCKAGKTILHVLPAQINRKLATAETYGLAFAIYLNSKFDRNDEETMTVLLDVRAGEGWPNPMAFTLINFIRTVSKMLLQLYPERLERMIIFPVPKAAMYVWSAVKSFYRSGELEKFVLVPGPANARSPLPRELLAVYIEDDVLDQTEEKRLGTFKPIGTF